MATTGHESEAIDVQGLKASLQKLKTNHIDGKAPQSNTYTKAETDAKIQTAITTRFAPTYVEQTKSLVFNINAPTYSPETKSLVFG